MAGMMTSSGTTHRNTHPMVGLKPVTHMAKEGRGGGVADKADTNTHLDTGIGLWPRGGWAAVAF